MANFDIPHLSLSDSTNIEEPRKIQCHNINHFQTFAEVLAYSEIMITDCVQKLQKDQHINEKDNILLELRRLVVNPGTKTFPLVVSASEYRKILKVAVRCGVLEVITSLILTYRVQNLVKGDISSLIDCFWILSCISHGKKRFANEVVDTGTVLFAMDVILNSPFIPLVTQCLMLLNNVMVSCTESDILEDILDKGLCQKVQDMFDSVDNECKAQIVQLYAKMAHVEEFDVPQIPTQQMMMRQASTLLDCTLPANIVLPAVEFMRELSTREGVDVLDFLLQTNFLTRLIACVTLPDKSVRVQSLRIVNELVVGHDKRTWDVLKSGLLNHMLPLLHFDDIDTMRCTLSILSNLATGDSGMINIFFELNIFDHLVFFLKSAHFEYVIDTMLILTNMVTTRNKYLKGPDFVAHRGMITGFISILISGLDDPEKKDYDREECYRQICHIFMWVFSFLTSDGQNLLTYCKQVYSELGLEETFKQVAAIKKPFGEDYCGESRGLVKFADTSRYLLTLYRNLGKEDAD